MKSQKKNSKVLLCVSGGIAAYKAPHIVRGFIQSGYEVRVVLTESAEAFVSSMVLATLSGNMVWRDSDFLSIDNGWKIPHIELSEWADVIIVAPCTADTLARLTAGHGNRLMDAVLLATRAPVVLFPAMNVNMLSHPATVKNMEIAASMGYTVVDSDTGDLACGYEGKGRLPDRDIIIAEAERALRDDRDMEGMTVTITAGPTREFLDPVRFISNPSSGKMGYALARIAWYRGAIVRLISGPVNLPVPHGVELISVVSALEMLEAAREALPDSDVIVKAAAVGDYRAKEFSNSKIKRGNREEVSFALLNNPDIAAALGKLKRQDQTLVGFAAETDDMETNALKKLKSKNLDLIVANNLRDPDSGFGTDTNRVKFINGDGISSETEGTKEEVADRIWSEILRLRKVSR